jgi:hypothetical protein
VCASEVWDVWGGGGFVFAVLFLFLLALVGGLLTGCRRAERRRSWGEERGQGVVGVKV